MTLYEQLLANGTRIDLSVFYDGANDLTVQRGPIGGVPTHYDIPAYARKLSGGGPKTDTDLGRSVRGWWSVRSLVARAIVRLRGGVSGAGYNPDADVAPPPESLTNQQGDEKGVWMCTVDVFRSGGGLIQDLSLRYGVADFYFWQPQLDDHSELGWAVRNVGKPTVDLSHVLDSHSDAYLDSVHTNERGARLVAEAMWSGIRPVVEESRIGTEITDRWVALTGK